jgi:hypothetical protein
MSDSRKSESTVTINAKPSSFNIRALRAPAAGTDIAEGLFITESSGRAALAGAADRLVFLNFLTSDAGSTRDTVAEHFSGPSPSIQVDTGGSSGIIGNGIEVAIPLDVADVTAVGTPSLGDLVTSGASGVPTVIASAGATPFHGIVSRVERGKVFFHFDSIARVL